MWVKSSSMPRIITWLESFCRFISSSYLEALCLHLQLAYLQLHSKALLSECYWWIVVFLSYPTLYLIMFDWADCGVSCWLHSAHGERCCGGFGTTTVWIFSWALSHCSWSPSISSIVIEEQKPWNYQGTSFLSCPSEFIDWLMIFWETLVVLFISLNGYSTCE